MKKAINILVGIGAFGVFVSISSCAMARQLQWKTPLVAGVYIFIVSLAVLLTAAVLSGVDWIRRNVRIQ